MRARPATAWASCVLLISKARELAVSGGSRANRRLFGTAMTASDSPRSCSSACFARRERLAPSKEKGVVTMKTIGTPHSRPSRASSRGAVLPTPPPSPAPTNAMRASFSRARSSSSDAAAARSARSVSPPQPSPRAQDSPSCSVRSTRTSPRAARSVSAATTIRPGKAQVVHTISAIRAPPRPAPMRRVGLSPVLAAESAMAFA